MKQTRAGQAASVVPNSLVWRDGLKIADEEIHAMIAQDMKGASELLLPDITPEEAERIIQLDRARVLGDQQIERWIRSLRHTPPVLIADMPTLNEVDAFYSTSTVKVPGYPVLR
jgi:hypothetical protein